MGYISNVIADVISRAKRGTKYAGNEVHHIVAKSDYRAYQGRALLGRYSISVESSYNKVSIRKTLHKHLHNNEYHADS